MSINVYKKLFDPWQEVGRQFKQLCKFAAQFNDKTMSVLKAKNDKGTMYILLSTQQGNFKLSVIEL